MPRDSGSLAGPSRARDEADDAAARRVRRQKRREEEAYHVKGWENLYGGGGSKPVFAHDPLPSSKTRRQGQSLSQSPTKSTRDPASSSRRLQSPAKASDSSSASASKLPPSTAPPTTRSITPHASTPRLTKRKASTPSSHISPSKKSKAAAAAPTTRRQTVHNSDDSDDDFEITGASGPAATRFSSNVAPASSVKASPSADSPLNARRSSSSRRSVSKAPSEGVQSPAAPFLPAQDDGHTPSTASAPASRGASQTRVSASSSSRSTPGPAKLTAEEIEALKETALREYEQGISLAQHIDNSVRDFTAGLSADHPDMPIVSQLQRKVADLGAQLTIKELRIDMPALPPRLQKRFAPAVAAYVKYLKREGAQTQGDAVPDNVATSSIRSPDPVQQQAPDNGNSSATLNNDVGHESAVESPQAFGTPPEQPLDDLDEAATTHPSPPRAASTPTASKAQEPAEELESDAEEQEARATSAIPQEADEPEEEDELIDELEDDDRGDINSGEQHRSAPAKPSELSTEDPTAEADVEALVTGSADSISRADAAVAHPPSDKQNLLQTGDADETAPDSRIEGIQQLITQEASDVAERLEHRPTEGLGEEMAPPISNSPPDEGNDGALVTAADQIEGAAAAGGITQSFTATQERPADLDAERVASAVEAVEQVLAEDGEVLPESVETSENLPNNTSAIVASAQAPNSVATLTNEIDAVDDGSSAAATEAVTAAVTATPHLAPLQSDANEIGAEAQSSEIQTPAEARDADAIADAATIGDAMSQTLAVAVATLPAENAQEAEAPDLPNAAEAHLDTGNAPADAAESSDPAGPTAEDLDESVVAEALDEPLALPNLNVAETSVTAGEARLSRSHERASSQTASDAGTGSRAKKTIDDRMKSMLNDLAKVTGRRSSYETVKELKPKRAGLATPRTVQDVVDKWQDPAQMIPWTCLQELGPGIFHKNAHKHMHLSMHELMDKVSSTKAVKHLSDRLPERVMTRALMEFPRVPHMMHCWNEEKRKYFDSRGLAQPKDTKPEFRFADEEEEVEGGMEVSGNTSAPPAGHGGAAGHLVVQDQKPRSPSPVMAAAQGQAMTGQLLGSHFAQASRPQPAPVVHPNVSQINLVQLPPRPTPVPQASTQRQHHVQPAHAPRSQPTLQEAFQRVQATSTAVAPAALAAPAPLVHAQPMGALTNERRAAMLRQATDRVFSGIAADCLSLAEHVIGSPASAIGATVRKDHAGAGLRDGSPDVDADAVQGQDVFERRCVRFPPQDGGSIVGGMVGVVGDEQQVGGDTAVSVGQRSSGIAAIGGRVEVDVGKTGGSGE